MTGDAACLMLTGVISDPAPTDRIALRLELEAGSEPISGRLVGPDGSGEDFVGWLGLGAALERLTNPDGDAVRSPSRAP